MAGRISFFRTSECWMVIFFYRGRSGVVTVLQAIEKGVCFLLAPKK